MRLSIKNQKQSDHGENVPAPAVSAPPVNAPDNTADIIQPETLQDHTAQITAPKKSRKSRSQTDIKKIAPSDLEKVEGDIVQPLAVGDLPPDIVERISDTIDNVCIRYKIDDLRKATAQQWGAVCIAVGMMFKTSRLLHDTEREKREGGWRYDPQRVAALVLPWAQLCGIYDKTPLAGDFISFSGISETWFYNVAGHKLTSAGGEIYKKVLMIQERGLSAVLSDGRRNPTGSIFILKNWHGWRDQREVIHTDGGSAAPVANYPDFPMIGDNSGSDEGI